MIVRENCKIIPPFETIHSIFFSFSAKIGCKYCYNADIFEEEKMVDHHSVQLFENSTVLLICLIRNTISIL